MLIGRRILLASICIDTLLKKGSDGSRISLNFKTPFSSVSL